MGLELVSVFLVAPWCLASAALVWLGHRAGRGARPAAAALHGVVGWFALVPPSVAAMGAVMLARDDPCAAPGQVGVLASVAVLFAAYALMVFRSLFTR